ncbi:hypothetical protein [Mucilaginibacter sp.]|uniref:hypothetical protein n=1 Tax=Mucilaginibacter sp. TaxID=1882438 RepID=UPI0025D283B4|nr:hypothetical protein [Mucilaginibacter sp.]
MGAWSAVILGNDTTCEIHERFLELYDLGENPDCIATIVLEEQKENLVYDRTNVWLGLALACWECKVLTTEIFEEVEKIVDTKEDIKYNEELDADAAFLKKREKVLEDFIVKIGKPKEKARARKKIPVQIESPYVSGMCLSYKNSSGKYIGIYLTESEHFKNRGQITFWFLDFELDTVPELSMYSNARLFGLKKLGPEWGKREYMGNVTDISYEKATKTDFFINVPKVLNVVGKLGVCNHAKLTNNFSSGFKNLNDSNDIIRALEQIRTEGKSKHAVSDLTLCQLLEKIQGEGL